MPSSLCDLCDLCGEKHLLATESFFVSHCHDLGHDGDGDFCRARPPRFRPIGAWMRAIWSAEMPRSSRASTRLAWVPGGAEGADVGHGEIEGHGQGWVVQLFVVGEDDDVRILSNPISARRSAGQPMRRVWAWPKRSGVAKAERASMTVVWKPSSLPKVTRGWAMWTAPTRLSAAPGQNALDKEVRAGQGEALGVWAARAQLGQGGSGDHPRLRSRGCRPRRDGPHAATTGWLSAHPLPAGSRVSPR